MNLIALQIPLDFIRLYPSFDQRGIKAFLQKRQALQIILIQFINVPLLIPLVIEHFPNPGKYPSKLLCIDRLEQILLHLDVDRFLCIFKFIKPGKDDDFYIRVLFLELPTHGKSIHIRHLDIRQDNIRNTFLCHLQCLHPIMSITTDLESHTLPINFFHDDLNYIFLIIHQQN